MLLSGMIVAINPEALVSAFASKTRYFLRVKSEVLVLSSWLTNTYGSGEHKVIACDKPGFGHCNLGMMHYAAHSGVFVIIPAHEDEQY